jgi:uncharacterized protein YjbI with pentapeptide repeats
MNEERMQILQLLQDGKISVDEATKLLEATPSSPVEAEPSRAQNGNSDNQTDDEEQAKDNGRQTPRGAQGLNLQSLVGVYLGGAQLAGARFQGADLTGAYLGDADLRNADLREANLTGTYLGNAKLRNANLRGANLTGAYLEHADLEEANLEGVDLTGAYMPGLKYRNGEVEFAA